MVFAQTFPGCRSRAFPFWLVLSCIFVGRLPICSAGDKEDKAAAYALIVILENAEAGQAKPAEALFHSIPMDSSVKPQAAYSFALIQMREGRYSEAWKALAAPSVDLDGVPTTIKIGTERLKLWLLLEAGSADKAEPQFKRLVTTSLAPDSANGEQTSSCCMIGAVIGMLKTQNKNPCIPIPILDDAKEAMLQRIENKNAKSKLE